MKFERKEDLFEFRDLVNELIEKLEIKTKFDIELLKKNWKIIVGPILCQHSRPAEIKGNVLIVLCDHSIFTGDFFSKIRIFLKKIETLFKGSGIKSIKVYNER